MTDAKSWATFASRAEDMLALACKGTILAVDWKNDDACPAFATVVHETTAPPGS